MIIEEERDEKKTEKIGSLSTGDTFVRGGELWIVTDERSSANRRRRLCVCLGNGVLLGHDGDIEVEKVNRHKVVPL